MKGLENCLIVSSLHPSIGPSAQGRDLYSRGAEGTVLALWYHKRIPSPAPLRPKKPTHFVSSIFGFKPERAKKLPYCFVKLTASIDDTAITLLLIIN
jgi:hypothetical protein